LGKEERGEEISALLATQLLYFRIVGRAFRTVIPRVIIVVPVAIIFAVGFVVFVVVADEIVEGEAVVRGDEVDAGIGAAPAVLVKIGASRQAIASSPILPSSPFQKLRTASRYLPFHSAQRTGKCRPDSLLRRHPMARRSTLPVR
jgi:hypothetical protein